jgi:hypothetical protein
LRPLAKADGVPIGQSLLRRDNPRLALAAIAASATPWQFASDTAVRRAGFLKLPARFVAARGRSLSNEESV